MMQLTTLNKVVSLFLVGGLVLLAVICLFGPDLDHIYIFSESRAQALLILVGALSLLALAAAVGAVVDTLASLTIGLWLSKCITHIQLANCLGHGILIVAFDFMTL